MSLIGEIIERNGNSSNRHTNSTVNQTTNGFPIVEHRSKAKSEFAKAKARQRQAGATKSPIVPPKVQSKAANDWKEDISRSNEERVVAMTPEEREKEVEEIKEQLGAGIEDLMRRVKEAKMRREKKEQVSADPDDLPPLEHADPPDLRVSNSASKSIRSSLKGSQTHAKDDYPSRSTTGDSSKFSCSNLESVLKPFGRPDRPATSPSTPIPRRLRFTEPGPSDVHVYESAPSSPRKVMGLLLPLSDDETGEGESIPKLKYSTSKVVEPIGAPEEGTPDFIRERYFPNENPGDPALEWMRSSFSSNDFSDELSACSSSEARYDLSGRLIPEKEAEKLPTHLGLHHHADPLQRAGYTLSDLLHLSRSTVASQRSTMLTVLSRILSQDSAGKVHFSPNSQQIKQIVAVGVEAFSARGSISVSAAGIQVIWSALCAKGTSRPDPSLEFEMLDQTVSEVAKSLPLEFLLPTITEHLSNRILPTTAESQLLQILSTLALASSSISKQIIETIKLISTIFSRFLSHQHLLSEVDVAPSVLALILLRTLVKSSRENAKELCPLCDSLLRYIATEPTSDSDSIVAEHTLTIYASLARYGLKSDLSTTAAELFVKLEKHISTVCQDGKSSVVSQRLASAYFFLIECWIVCATDPHATTPSHDVLWSQVVAWCWDDTLLDVVTSFTGPKFSYWDSACHALSAWLEGCWMNAPKRGEAERRKVRSRLSKSLLANPFIERPHDGASSPETLSHHNAIIRLALASAIAPGEPDDENGDRVIFLSSLPSFRQSVFDHGSEKLGTLICSSMAQSCGFRLRLEMLSPDYDKKSWLSSAFQLLPRLNRATQYLAEWIISQLPHMLTPDIISSILPDVPTGIWHENPFMIITPLLLGSLRTFSPQLVPPHPTISSIQLSATQAISDIKFDEPVLSKMWATVPINHLLRSGSSPVFKALPESWSVSETAVVRSSLLLTLVVQAMFPPEKALKREEVVFDCMKVFMLEHDQPTSTSDTEVFRDEVVERMMTCLLAPNSYQNRYQQLSFLPASSKNPKLSLEDVSKSFLGEGTPFYQFYTDFIGLYNSISFSHPIFGSLLLPVLSSDYPPDYRSLLFVDYAHSLRTIKTHLSELLADDLSPFLYPIHTEPKLLAAFADALSSGQLDRSSFIYFFVVHHLASSIWSNVNRTSTASTDEVSLKILDSIVGKSRTPAILADLARYHQSAPNVTDGQPSILEPPVCFSHDDKSILARKEWLRRSGKIDVWNRLEVSLQG